MKTIGILFLILNYSLSIFAQSSKSVFWMPKASGQCNVCDQIIVDDATFRIINNDDVHLAVYLSRDGDYWVALVYLENKGERFDFSPTQNTGAAWWKTQKEWSENKNMNTISVIPPETIARKIQQRALWANAFRAFGAGMQTQTANVTVTQPGQLPTTATVTTPNTSAQQTAKQQNVQTSARAASESADLLSGALKANTLFQGSKILGNIYFQRKKAEVVSLQFGLNNATYTFTYVLKEK